MKTGRSSILSVSLCSALLVAILTAAWALLPAAKVLAAGNTYADPREIAEATSLVLPAYRARLTTPTRSSRCTSTLEPTPEMY